MPRTLHFTFAESEHELPRDSAGSLENLRVLEGPFPWACLETFSQTASPIPTFAPASYQAHEIGDTGKVDEPYNILMLVAFNVPPNRVEEVERWYIEEHVPLLMRAPGWLRARRYVVDRQHGPIRWTHLAFHELRSLAVLDSKERAYARSTPWRAELEKEPWFEQAGRLLFEPVK